METDHVDEWARLQALIDEADSSDPEARLRGAVAGCDLAELIGERDGDSAAVPTLLKVLEILDDLPLTFTRPEGLCAVFMARCWLTRVDAPGVDSAAQLEALRRLVDGGFEDYGRLAPESLAYGVGDVMRRDRLAGRYGDVVALYDRWVAWADEVRPLRGEILTAMTSLDAVWVLHDIQDDDERVLAITERALGVLDDPEARAYDPSLERAYLLFMRRRASSLAATGSADAARALLSRLILEFEDTDNPDVAEDVSRARDQRLALSPAAARRPAGPRGRFFRRKQSGDDSRSSSPD